MELSALQDAVNDFVTRHKIETTVLIRLLDLASEIGELAKEVLLGTGYGKADFRPTDGWDGELGDALFSLIWVANSTSVDLEQALHDALKKYQQRSIERGDVGSK